MNKFACVTIGSALVFIGVGLNTALAGSMHSQNHGQTHWNLRYGYRHAPYDGFRHKASSSYGYYPYGFGYLPYGGFFGASDNYVTDDYPLGSVSVVPVVAPLAPSLPALNCKYSQETRTVPSEDGGTKQVTITRC